MKHDVLNNGDRATALRAGLISRLAARASVGSIIAPSYNGNAVGKKVINGPGHCCGLNHMLVCLASMSKFFQSLLLSTIAVKV